MALFRYSAINQFGKTGSGYALSLSEEALAEKLKKHNSLLVQAQRIGWSRSLNLGHQEALFHEFAAMVNAGINLSEALGLIGLTESPYQSLVLRWKRGIESGKSLTQMTAASPEIDGRIVSKMVQVGESTGALGQNLQQLAAYFASLNQLKKRVISALLYPTIVLMVTIVAVVILTLYVIPMFLEMFQRYHLELPLITRFLIGATEFLRSYGLVIMALILASILVLRFRRLISRRWVYKILYRIPFLGNFLHHFMHLTLLRSLSNLLLSDIRVHDALTLLDGIYPDPSKSDALKLVAEKVVKGDSFSLSLKKTQLLPEKEIRIVQIGEDTGKLNEQIQYLAEMYENKVNFAISSFLALFEPMMIVGLSCMIGFVLVGLYLPLFDILSGTGLSR
ncbi:MAG: type II secretion system F family protein [Acidobacteria bacterium]|nr:type II secretion system F family protein [Acidobacteriota bacterium]MCB9399461.1 type II secretion system F family protein [Acidobacteriota bacterium]